MSLVARLLRRAHGVAAMNIGRGRAGKPLSTNWGFDRGTAIDRHYIESFLARHSADIRGDVLEIADDVYSKRFGGDRVRRQHILDLDEANPQATITGDLALPGTLADASFDCIIATQTLQYIFDLPAAVAQLHSALRPRGALLLTVPGIAPLDRSDPTYWSFTEASVRRLLSGPFDADHVSITAFGNLHAATAFLHGAAVQDTSVRKLAARDPAYPVTIAARAIA